MKTATYSDREGYLLIAADLLVAVAAVMYSLWLMAALATAGSAFILYNLITTHDPTKPVESQKEQS